MLKRSITVIILLLLTFSIQSRNNKEFVTEIFESKNSSTVISRTAIIEFAKNYLGTPYRYASAVPDKGFDCSGFVHFVFKKFGKVLPHSSKAFKSIGTNLKPEEFKVGDVLVFFGYRNSAEIGHVGIICEANGMKSKFIHSSSGKVKGVIISDLDSEMYSRRFYKCVDVIGGE
jgi:cell wall-associated NlpC family hydrolase